jgi:hypothetical protein
MHLDGSGGRQAVAGRLRYRSTSTTDRTAT